MRLIIDNSLVSSLEIAQLLDTTNQEAEASIEALANRGSIEVIKSDGISYVSASSALRVAAYASPRAFRIILRHWSKIEFCLEGEDQHFPKGVRA